MRHPQKRTRKRPVTTSFLGKRSRREARIVFVCAFVGMEPGGEYVVAGRQIPSGLRSPDSSIGSGTVPICLVSKLGNYHVRAELHAHDLMYLRASSVPISAGSMRHPNDEDDENLVPYVAYDAVVPSAVAQNTGKIADENLAATRISATFEMSMFSTVRLNVPAVLVRLKKTSLLHRRFAALDDIPSPLRARLRRLRLWPCRLVSRIAHQVGLSPILEFHQDGDESTGTRRETVLNTYRHLVVLLPVHQPVCFEVLERRGKHRIRDAEYESPELAVAQFLLL